MAILVFVATVVIATTVVVLAVRATTGFWATGVLVGAVAGGVSAAAYPVVFRRST